MVLSLVEFAREDPWIFFLTVPVAATAIVVVAFFVLRVATLDPMAGLARRYRIRRRRHRDPELPLDPDPELPE